jgi:hypothetical protein
MVQHAADIEQQLARVVDVLAQRFAGVHDRDAIAHVVDETRRRLEPGARVTTYLPLLVARHAADQLSGRREPTSDADRPSPVLSAGGLGAGRAVRPDPSGGQLLATQ